KPCLCGKRQRTLGVHGDRHCPRFRKQESLYAERGKPVSHVTPLIRGGPESAGSRSIAPASISTPLALSRSGTFTAFWRCRVALQLEVRRDSPSIGFVCGPIGGTCHP